MNRTAWNWLEVGDVVQVHHPRFPATAASAGEVTHVRVHSHGTNEVAIRLAGDDRVLIWPQHSTVHRTTTDVDDPCWRCAEVLGA